MCVALCNSGMSDIRSLKEHCMFLYLQLHTDEHISASGVVISCDKTWLFNANKSRNFHKSNVVIDITTSAIVTKISTKLSLYLV